MGHAQANLYILPSEYAAEFKAFCERNPQPCPLLAVTEAGCSVLPEGSVAPGADVAQDCPKYHILRAGEDPKEAASAKELWTKQSVAFCIGCSFSFEEALAAAGLPLRHVEQGRNVPMYITSRQCTPSGRFKGPLVVSMRPMTPEQAEQARAITARYPRVHGAPVHIGDPSALGIADLAEPDFGDAVDVREGEVPVFWACGVTPRQAVLQSGCPLVIGHAPGHMLVLDVRNEDLASSSIGGHANGAPAAGGDAVDQS